MGVARERAIAAIGATLGWCAEDAQSAAHAWFHATDDRGDQATIDVLVEHLQDLVDGGVSPAHAGAWIDITSNSNLSVFYAKLGYTPQQYGVIEVTLLGRPDAGIGSYSGREWQLWADRLSAYEPHFVTLCCRAGVVTLEEIDELHLRYRLDAEPTLDALRVMEALGSAN